jgi:hypothetical protein
MAKKFNSRRFFFNSGESLNKTFSSDEPPDDFHLRINLRARSKAKNAGATPSSDEVGDRSTLGF